MQCVRGLLFDSVRPMDASPQVRNAQVPNCQSTIEQRKPYRTTCTKTHEARTRNHAAGTTDVSKNTITLIFTWLIQSTSKAADLSTADASAALGAGAFDGSSLLSSPSGREARGGTPLSDGKVASVCSSAAVHCLRGRLLRNGPVRSVLGIFVTVLCGSEGAALALSGCGPAGLCVGGHQLGRCPCWRRHNDAVLLPPVVRRRPAPPLHHDAHSTMSGT